jgi:hypothetical protein
MATAAAPHPVPTASSRSRRRWWQWLCSGVLWIFLAGMTLWAIGALSYDFPFAGKVVATVYALVVLAIAAAVRNRILAKGLVLLGFVIVLAWWFTLRPSNERSWQLDVAQAPWAEIDGDKVTLHSVRNCEYRTESDYTPRWESRTVDLSKLRGLDLAINYWGSAWMAHPIASFQFEDALPVCFSIETRKEVGESYSAIGGLYRQYELVYVCADERDVIRVRTNYRHDEDVYLYRTTAPPAAVRQRFLEYVEAMNSLREKPRWYNAATTNCTTSIRTQHAAVNRVPWDWRMLFNGYGDEMLYERHGLAGDLPFAELKKRALIDEAAKAADTAPDFSARIRAGRPGFEVRANLP